MMSVAVVIGGCGFLGRHLVEELQSRGWSVRIFDIRKSYEDESVDFFVGDLCKTQDLEKAFSGADIVFHTASPPPSSNDRALFHRVNVAGTQAVISACKSTNIKALVLTSSASVVYEGRDIRNGTEDLPYAAKPMDAYIETKVLQEKAVLAAHGDDLATVAIRPHGIFGPRDPQLVPTTAQVARAGKLKYMIGNGQNVVDFTYVKNVVHGHILAAERLTKDRSVGGKPYLITNDEPVLFWDFMGWIATGLGYPGPSIKLPYTLIYVISFILQIIAWLVSPVVSFKPTFSPMRVALAGTHHYYSCARAKADLGYKPLVGVREALDITLASYPHLKKSAS